jgi:hypothetical protein
MGSAARAARHALRIAKVRPTRPDGRRSDTVLFGKNGCFNFLFTYGLALG